MAVVAVAVDMRALLVLIVPYFTLLFCVPSGALAQRSQQLLYDRLVIKESAVTQLKQSIENLEVDPSRPECANAVAPSSCAQKLMQPVCDIEFGYSKGCNCKGTAVDTRNYVIKESSYVGTTDSDVKAEVCRLKNVSAVFPDLFGKMIEAGETKWIYYGSSTGVLANYPGILWPRESQESTDCGNLYDPRVRPWYMSASTGPKNVILIIDKSGSMRTANRIGASKDAAKAVLNSLTHADYVGLVLFDSTASSYKGLTTLAKALPGFRKRLADAVDSVEPGGGTNFVDAFRAAFTLVDSSKEKGYTANCHTTYVFLTDGEADSPLQEIQNRMRSVTPKEHYFIISIGTGTKVEELQDLSCAVNGIFTEVGDAPPTWNERAYLQFKAKFTQAMSKFQRYYALMKSICKQENLVWSEAYSSIPDVFGPIATAASPVYDKSQRSDWPWHMTGVAAVDATVCDLYEKAPDTPKPQWPSTTVGGCTCASSYTYNGKSYQSCTEDDWSVPWCATENCGACMTESISTNCWDDCAPYGAKAVVESELLRRATSETCTDEIVLDECALEVLRDDTSESTTSTQCRDYWSKIGKADQACDKASEGYKKYEWAVHGKKPDFSAPSWAKSSFQSTGDMRPNFDPLYNDESKDCPCDSTLMKPSCVCGYVEDARAKAVEKKKEEEEKKKEEETDAGGIIVGAIFGILFPVFGVIVAVMVCRRRRGSMAAYNTNAGMNQQGGPIQMTGGPYPPPPGQQQPYMGGQPPMMYGGRQPQPPPPPYPGNQPTAPPPPYPGVAIGQPVGYRQGGPSASAMSYGKS